jgi:hypothetical protein
MTSAQQAKVPEPGAGSDASWAPFKRITMDIARSCPESEGGKSVPPDCYGLLHKVAGGLCSA